MCVNPITQISDETKVEVAKYALANIFKSKLDVVIDADDLGKFIVKQWHLISPLAHIIHGGSPYEFSGDRAKTDRAFQEYSQRAGWSE